MAETVVDLNNVPVDRAYEANEPLVNIMTSSTQVDTFATAAVADDTISSTFSHHSNGDNKSVHSNFTVQREYSGLPMHMPPIQTEKLEKAPELEGHENTDDHGNPLEVPSVPSATGHGDPGNTPKHMGNVLPAGEAVEKLESQQNVHISNERDITLKQLAADEGSSKKSANRVLTSIEPVDQVLNTAIHKYNKLPFFQFRMFILAFLVPLCFVLPSIFTGFIIGCYMCFVMYLYFHVNEPTKPKPVKPLVSVNELKHVAEKNAQAQSDIAVLHKCYKGWMNILNEPYNVHTSCYKDIQSVLVQLEGPILRISRPERLVMKHCTHDDPTFTEDYPPMLSQSSFDITNAKIKLRPKHLARRRWWVRRYPICIVLASPDDKMHIRDDERFAELQTELSEDGTTLINRKAPNQLGSITDDAINVARMSAERDSVATGAYDSDSDHEYELESEGEQVELRASASTDRIAKSSLQKNFPGPNTKPRGRTIYLFARTPREKERWFHVLRKACNKFSKPPHESDALELEKKMFLPEGWSLPENMNKHYFLYVLQEFRYGKHLDKVLTASVDNRTKREHLLANGGIVNMDLGRIGWHRSAHYQTDDLVVIANMFGSRILFDFYHDKDWCELFQGRIQAKLAAIHLPHFIETLELKEFDMGNVVPEITKIYKPVVDDWGMWLDFDLHYEGSLKLVLECYVDLTKLTSKPDPTDTNPATGHENGPHENEKYRDDPQSFKNEDLPCSPEMSPGEDFDAKITDLEKRPKKKKNTAEKVINVMDKVVHSDIFKKVASLKPVKKTMEKISATPLAITVEVTGMEGTLAINIPPPPSDRLWYAFREPPMITLKSVPQIGDRTVDFEKVSSWIETNIRELLYKLLVMPNMDDVSIVVLEGNELITGSLNL
jgi:hypothetical protein